jgi:hypothetical protein
LVLLLWLICIKKSVFLTFLMKSPSGAELFGSSKSLPEFSTLDG